MSECVVRMEMPENCEDCAAQYDCMACGITGTLWYRSEEFDPSNGCLPDCPIICQLPEGHGRLLEEKSVRWAIDDIVLEIANRTGRVWMTKDETMEYINNLCTIVPAEAERSET